MSRLCERGRRRRGEGRLGGSTFEVRELAGTASEISGKANQQKESKDERARRVEMEAHFHILERLVHNLDRLNSLSFRGGWCRRNLVDGRRWRRRKIVEEVMSDGDGRSERRRKRRDGGFGS